MAEHQRIALWTPLRGAAVFETVSSSMPDVLLFNLVPTPGVKPGTTAVRSGVCMFHYTLRALDWLPGIDSHDDDRRNRPTGYFTSRGILKWWTRTVTLRLLLGANQPCSLPHYEPFETGGPCGLCSRYLSLDRRVL